MRARTTKARPTRHAGARIRRLGHAVPPRPSRPEPLAQPEAHPYQARARRAGGPQDKALYGCACGVSFQAPVTASVRCPHCGSEQAW